MCESRRSRQTPASSPKISPIECGGVDPLAGAVDQAVEVDTVKGRIVVVLHQVLADLVEHLLASPPVDGNRLGGRRRRERDGERSRGEGPDQGAKWHATPSYPSRHLVPS